MAAKDPTACLPPDLEAWRRLAREVIIQAARDVMWNGLQETKADHADAYRFFYSKGKLYVHYREVWFGLAGCEVPKDMDRAVEMIAGLRFNGNGR